LARTYRQLDLDQRRTLFRLVEARTPVGEIAERLGRHPSTIYRELGRNRFRDGGRGFCGYFPLNARDLARRRRQRRRKLAADEGLRAHVTERLEAGWSPQQIAGRLKHEQADGGPTVCHETIYRHVYGPEGREDGLYRHLPKARRRRGSRHGRRPRSTPIPRERWIENRPAEVEERESFGHWEADLLIFRKEHGKANVTSLVERKSRFTFLLANEDKRSTAVIAGIADALRPLPAGRSPSTAGLSSPPIPSSPASSTWPATSATRTARGRKGASRTPRVGSGASCRARARPRRSRASACGGWPTG
jgi:transposase, IS30 family